MNTPDYAIPDSQPLAMMTAGDLRALIAEEWSRHENEIRIQCSEQPEIKADEPRYIYGLKKMAEYLGMTEKTFNRNRKKGIFDGCIRQLGQQYRAKKEDLDAAYDRHIC